MTDMRERMASLSPRQREVLLAVANRLSSKEIARTLGLSPATVDSHIAAALQRLGLASRRDAAIEVARLGLVAERPPTHWEESAGSDAAEANEEATSRHFPHGGDLPGARPPGGRDPLSRISSRWKSAIHRSSAGNGVGRPPRSPDPLDTVPRRVGMGEVVVRYLLDGLYISLFFSAMSAVAFLAHEIVIQCEHRHMDPVVLVILKGVSYVLAGIDGIGVITATSLLTYRFITAIVRAND